MKLFDGYSTVHYARCMHENMLNHSIIPNNFQIRGIYICSSLYVDERMNGETGIIPEVNSSRVPAKQQQLIYTYD